MKAATSGVQVTACEHRRTSHASHAESPGDRLAETVPQSLEAVERFTGSTEVDQGVDHRERDRGEIAEFAGDQVAAIQLVHRVEGDIGAALCDVDQCCLCVDECLGVERGEPGGHPVDVDDDAVHGVVATEPSIHHSPAGDLVGDELRVTQCAGLVAELIEQWLGEIEAAE